MTTNTVIANNDYPYDKYINSPEKIGMSDEGSLKTLGKDITGLIAYTQLLVEGGGPASATGGTLGNKYFLNAGSKCMDVDTKTDVDRYVFIDNVPSFGGLIPGLIESTLKINPAGIMSAAFQSGKQDCKKITLQTIDGDNNKKNETHYVTLTDIDGDDLIDLGEGFQNMASPTFPKDALTQIYFASLAGLSVLLFYRLIVNRSP
jgi:hypothetical protein